MNETDPRLPVLVLALDLELAWDDGAESRRILHRSKKMAANQPFSATNRSRVLSAGVFTRCPSLGRHVEQ